MTEVTMVALRFLLAALLLTAGAVQAQGQAFQIMPDTGKGFASFFIRAPAYVDERVLAANVAETHTIPTGYNAVAFASNCAEFRAKTGASVAVASADVTDGTGSMINPTQWFTGAATQLSLIAPATCKVSLVWFSFTP